MTFNSYGVTGLELQYWDGLNWLTVPNSNIANNKVWVKFTFSPVTASKIRVVENAALAGYSRIVEVEAWGAQTSPPPTRTNYALASNGGVTSASSQYSNDYLATAVNDGDRKGINWGSGSGWNDATVGVYPDWLQIDFGGSKSLDEIDVFTLQDNFIDPIEPAESTTFSNYGITAFDVQYWNGSDWVTVPGGSITNNNRVWTKITFPAIRTAKVRVLVNASLAGYSRIVEVEAFGVN